MNSTRTVDVESGTITGTTIGGRKWSARVSQSRFGSRTLRLWIDGCGDYGVECQRDTRTSRGKVTMERLQRSADDAEKKYEASIA